MTQNCTVDAEAERLRAADRFGAFVMIRPDATAVKGPIAGATLAVKDNIAVAGLPWTAGHPLFAARHAERDAEAVVRLRTAGTRVIGVTQTDAGGFGVTTPAVENPILPGRTVGGSSGGSAAAVAAGLADLGLGTDTGGSVRIPAACTGIYGWKPTRGRVSLAGVWPLAPSFDHVGLLARDLELLERGAAVLLGEADPPSPTLSPLPFGVDFDRLRRCDQPIQAAFAAVCEALASAGVEIRGGALPSHDAVARAHGVLVLAEAREVYGGLDRTRLAETASRTLPYADAITEADIARARREADAIRSAVDKALTDVDLLMTPTLAVAIPERHARRVVFAGVEAPVVGALTAETALFNLTGHPALAMPVPGRGSPPFSIQLAAAHGHDLALLAAARTISRHLTHGHACSPGIAVP